MLKGLIFDVDGTLVNNSELHIEAFKLLFRKYGCVGDFDEKWFARRNEDILRGLCPEAVAKYGWERISEEKETIYREQFGPQIRPVPGIVELVKSAADEGLKCCVGSSAPRQNVEFHLDICGIKEYMEGWLSMEDVTIGKPDPEVYLKCCRMLGYDPSECIVFEDARAGIEAGKAAGCKVVAVATWNSMEMLRGETAADLVVRDFTECTVGRLRGLLG